MDLEKNTALYYLLDELDCLPTDFSIDKVISFDNQDDFYIVFYLSKERRFVSFIAKEYLQIVDSLPNLLNEIVDYSAGEIHPSLIDEAINHIESKMHSKNNNRFYFDAH